MHEASVMNALMRKIETIAEEQGAARVVGVSVRLGALSHMTPGHFTEHFVQASAGGIAEGAALDIDVSEDPGEDWAQEVLLESVEIET